jgi:hypothetical protein
MKRLLLAACAAASIALVGGCATHSPYGSFLTAEAPAPFDGIATDAVRKLAATWKPAKTRLAIQHPSADPFGAAFVGALRTQGYSVLEFTPPGKAQPAAPAASDAAPATDLAGEAVPVSYVLDRAGDFYRLKLLAGREVLSRAYVVNAGQFAPAGAWSLLRQE